MRVSTKAPIKCKKRKWLTTESWELQPLILSRSKLKTKTLKFLSPLSLFLFFFFFFYFTYGQESLSLLSVVCGVGYSVDLGLRVWKMEFWFGFGVSKEKIFVLGIGFVSKWVHVGLWAKLCLYVSEGLADVVWRRERIEWGSRSVLVRIMREKWRERKYHADWCDKGIVTILKKKKTCQLPIFEFKLV